MALWMGGAWDAGQNFLFYQQSDDELESEIFTENGLGEEEGGEAIPEHFSLSLHLFLVNLLIYKMYCLTFAVPYLGVKFLNINRKQKGNNANHSTIS